MKDSRTSNRLLLIAAGGLIGFLCVFGVFALWSPKGEAARARHRHHKCLPYFLIPQLWICGKKVYLTHPHMPKEYAGRTSDLSPMPKPPPDRRR